MFSAKASQDPDGDSLTFTWLPGDGRVFSGNTGTIEQGWSYADNGTYPVSVIVADNRGAADTAGTTLTVVNVPPSITLFTPTQQAIGDRAATRFALSDSGALDTHRVTIYWGDGEGDSVAEGPGWLIDSLTHAYVAAGSYAIHAVVRDKDGGATTLFAPSAVHVYSSTEHRTIAGYNVFDLGTLGGNSTRPLDFNDYGQIVGSSRTASGATHAFVWDNGVMHDLGTLGNEGSEAQRINNAGLIAGVVWSARHDDCGENYIGAVWSNRVGTVLGSQAAVGRPVKAVTMDEAGDVVWSACGHEVPWAWLSRDNTWTPLGSLLGSDAPSWVYSMNEHRQIVGTSWAVYNADDAPDPYSHAFIWDNGTMRDLGQLAIDPCLSHPDKDCGSSTALGVNESGQIVGYSTDANNSLHMVLWTNGTVHELWPLTASGSYHSGALIDDAGQVAGSWGGEAFFWSGGQLSPIGSLGGGGTEVVDMNEAGEVVGTSLAPNGERHVFVWTKEHGMVDLGTGPHGFNTAGVVGISYHGDIAGFTGQCTPGVSCYASEVRAVLWRHP